MSHEEQTDLRIRRTHHFLQEAMQEYYQHIHTNLTLEQCLLT